MLVVFIHTDFNSRGFLFQIVPSLGLSFQFPNYNISALICLHFFRSLPEVPSVYFHSWK